MSGQAGFAPIGNQPIFQPNGIGNAENIDNNVAPDGVQQLNAQQPQPEVAPQPQPNARSLAQRLDTILATAAKAAVQAVDAKAVKAAAADVKMKSDERTALAAVAQRAKRALDALSGFTGRQIASALVADENGVFDWKKTKGFFGGEKIDSTAKALRDAIDAQFELSAQLKDLLNGPRPEGMDEAFAALEEMALQCDRRASEISTLALELADAVAQAGDDPALNAKLDARLSALLPQQAVSMHGTGEALEKLRAQLEPLAARIEDFASRPGASVTSEEYMAYKVEVKDARAALQRLANEGLPTSDGGRVLFDKSLLGTAAELVKFAEKKLDDTARRIGRESLKAFVNKSIGCDDYPQCSKGNLPMLRNYCPNLAEEIELRHKLKEVALAYIDKPSPELDTKFTAIIDKLKKIDKFEVMDELDMLSRRFGADPGGPSPVEWKEFKSQFRVPAAVASQVEHFKIMAKNREAMKPDQFLSTTSATALLEGKLRFSTLVEARIHGMSDDDVDPVLDDSRLVSSKTLGVGNANTVSLVTYEDGSERVFKPEAPGRQGMESLLLSKDYKNDQQVANLNLAVQDAAIVLGATDVMPKCSVGCHDGQYGLFMEKAPGVDSVAFEKNKRAPGCLSSVQVSNLPPDQHAQVAGGIMRGLNRLEWLDLLAGQGDRHAHNYLIAIKPDLSVSVKGIDNDQSYPAYRTGLRAYRLTMGQSEAFFDALDELVSKYPKQLRPQVRAELRADPGIRQNDDGSFTIDTSKFQHPELHYPANRAIGMHGATLPNYIDEELCENLLALKAGERRDTYLANLARRLPPEAVASATNRLDEAIALAERYKAERKVVKKDDFFKADVQKEILKRDVEARKNPTKPIQGKTLADKKITHRIERQMSSFFVRDLYSTLWHQNWM